MQNKNWKILAYLKNAIADKKEEIAEPKAKSDLIDAVMKIRELKRVELSIKHIDTTKK